MQMIIHFHPFMPPLAGLFLARFAIIVRQNTPELCFGSHYCVLGANIRERLLRGRYTAWAIYWAFHARQFVARAPKNLVDANNNQESALSVKIVRGSFGQPEHVRGYGFIYFLQHTITANRGALERGGVYQASIIESLPTELPPPDAI